MADDDFEAISSAPSIGSPVPGLALGARETLDLRGAWQTLAILSGAVTFGFSWFAGRKADAKEQFAAASNLDLTTSEESELAKVINRV
jgi:hypothetical protein